MSTNLNNTNITRLSNYNNTSLIKSQKQPKQYTNNDEASQDKMAPKFDKVSNKSKIRVNNTNNNLNNISRSQIVVVDDSDYNHEVVTNRTKLKPMNFKIESKKVLSNNNFNYINKLPVYNKNTTMKVGNTSKKPKTINKSSSINYNYPKYNENILSQVAMHNNEYDNENNNINDYNKYTTNDYLVNNNIDNGSRYQLDTSNYVNKNTNSMIYNYNDNMLIPMPNELSSVINDAKIIKATPKFGYNRYRRRDKMIDNYADCVNPESYSIDFSQTMEKIKHLKKMEKVNKQVALVNYAQDALPNYQVFHKDETREMMEKQTFQPDIFIEQYNNQTQSYNKMFNTRVPNNINNISVRSNSNNSFYNLKKKQMRSNSVSYNNNDNDYYNNEINGNSYYKANDNNDYYSNNNDYYNTNTNDHSRYMRGSLVEGYYQTPLNQMQKYMNKSKILNIDKKILEVKKDNYNLINNYSANFDERNYMSKNKGFPTTTRRINTYYKNNESVENGYNSSRSNSNNRSFRMLTSKNTNKMNNNLNNSFNCTSKTTKPEPQFYGKNYTKYNPITHAYNDYNTSYSNTNLRTSKSMNKNFMQIHQY